MSSANLALRAPLSGPLMPITEVPDPVFAQKLVGDGISIDPINDILRAPCDGKVVQLHRACHAITIQAENGLEIMMHIGIDTVGLKGAGFSPKVAIGDQVKTGDELIQFDLDFIATKAKSLLTQIIVLNSDQVKEFRYGSGFANINEDIILELTPIAASGQEESNNFTAITSKSIPVPNPTGLHARPTAMLVAEAKKFTSTIQIDKAGEKANAKSLVSIMGLEVNCGDIITVVASGADAEQAIASLVPLVESGLGEDCPPISSNASSSANTAEAIDDEGEDDVDVNTDPNLLKGVSASPGLAIGKVFQLKRDEIKAPETGGDAASEQAALKAALTTAHSQLQELQDKVDDKEKAAIFAAHQELLDDPELIESCEAAIQSGKSAAFAWQTAYNVQAEMLSKLKNEVLAGRANDLRDVGRRVLQLVMGLAIDETEVPDNTILIAEDLTPSDTANLDRDKVLGFCTQYGGSSSHVAILARSMNIPAIAGIEARALNIENGTAVILDADKAELTLNPTDDDIAKLKAEQIAIAKTQQEEMDNAHLPATTTDAHTVEVVANIANVGDAEQATELHGEGVGLLRSEFVFMDRATAPDEEEQLKVYSDIAKALKPGQPLVIRTLDVGGDKPLSYLPIAKEENPFLGLRGIRVMLKKTKLFRIQLRAILRAAEFGNVHVMFPMITTIDDLRQSKIILEEEREKLGVKAIPIGIMVEVPATAVMAEQFAKEVDFFSIGTNDLTQYTLAIDRGHPTLAAQADGLNPGVLALIANTVKGAHKHGAWVGVCGGIASDPAAAPILVGMGVDELSVSVPSIPAIKACIRGRSLKDCQELAAKAVEQDSADAVRALVQSY